MKYKDLHVELKDKYSLTIDEAAVYYSIGINKLRELCEGDPDYILKIGKKILIKRQMFSEYLDTRYDL